MSRWCYPRRVTHPAKVRIVGPNMSRDHGVYVTLRVPTDLATAIVEGGDSGCHLCKGSGLCYLTDGEGRDGFHRCSACGDGARIGESQDWVLVETWSVDDQGLRQSDPGFSPRGRSGAAA